MTFEQWMKAVDREVEAIIGLSVHDLADADFRSWFEDEMEPEEAAAYLLEAEGLEV